MTQTGALQAFRPGLMRVLEGIHVPTIPVYLDELWGSVFSRQGGRGVRRRAGGWRIPISIRIGPPEDGPWDAYQARRAVQDLGAQAVRERSAVMPFVTCELIRSCKNQKRRVKVADSLGAEFTGGSLLMRSLILRRLLRKYVLQADEQYVGVLLPPSVPAIVANAALSLDRRVAVNLNYTVSQDVIQDCIRQAGIKRVLTSRRVMEKLGLELNAEVIMLEDLRDRVSLADKVLSGLATYVMPASA